MKHLSVQAFQSGSVVCSIAMVTMIVVAMISMMGMLSFNVIEAGSDQAQSENSKNNSCFHRIINKL